MSARTTAARRSVQNPMSSEPLSPARLRSASAFLELTFGPIRLSTDHVVTAEVTYSSLGRIHKERRPGCSDSATEPPQEVAQRMAAVEVRGVDRPLGIEYGDRVARGAIEMPRLDGPSVGSNPKRVSSSSTVLVTPTSGYSRSGISWGVGG